MHERALAPLAVLMVLSCGQGPPDFDVPSPAGRGVVDANAPSDANTGVRVLSDVAVPRGNGDTDGPSSGGRGGGARDSSSGDREQDGPVDARRDGSPEGGRDGPIDVHRDGAADVRIEVDANGDAARPVADHLLITEIATRPSGAEMIEIANLTGGAVVLSDYLLSDSHLYYEIAFDAFTTASGSDFVARFPEGFVIQPGQYVVVALANASGGLLSFEAAYGKKPDFELRPTANGATDDPEVPNMQPAQTASSIGATASLTDGGEPVVLFCYQGSALVSDIDYVFYGTPSASNPAVDKTGIVVSGSSYADDTAAPAQRPIPAPPEGGSLHRCASGESDEKRAGGNGSTGHDETSEDMSAAFVFGMSVADRTPGGPPPPGICDAISNRR